MKMKDIILSVASGMLMILAFPDFNLSGLAWVCLVPMLFAAHKKEPSMGFLAGCVTGSVFQCGLIYWVTVSMSIYGNLPAYLSIGLLILFSVFLSIFIAVPVYLSCYAEKVLRWEFTITLPLFWTASEYMKSWFLTGFPWENLGYSQFHALNVIQIADITGVYGISFILVFANCVVFSLMQGFLKKRMMPYKETALLILFLALILSYGHKRINDYKNPRGSQLKLAIIQPNISQDIKWDPSYLDKTMETFRALSEESSSDHPFMIVWPESATPFFYEAEDNYKKIVGDIVKKTDSYLLLGSPSWEVNLRSRIFFNSSFLISPENMIVGKYDKVHLVPYGEYVPLNELFPFIQKMVEGIGDFSPGREIKNLNLPSCSFATLICYEIIFPDLTRRFVKKGANFIVNITNDAWFGETSAPYQHLSMAVLRAVENKRFLVRAANTGISAYIDPVGSIYKQTKLFTQSVLSGIIVCRDDQTFYTLYGDIFAISCFAISLFFIVLILIRKKHYKEVK